MWPVGDFCADSSCYALSNATDESASRQCFGEAGLGVSNGFMTGSGSITILAMGRSEEQALLDWSRGLDWVRWMLGDIRSRLETLSTGGSAPYEPFQVKTAWVQFVQEVFTPVLGPALRKSWHAAQAGQTRRLMTVAQEVECSLAPAVAELSGAAAHILLRSTRGAVCQEVLGKHRAAIAEERCPAHLVVVWAAVGVLFQLGLANVCAEYLRLEWAMLSRNCPDLTEPEGDFGIASLTRDLVSSSGLLAGLTGVEDTQKHEA